jgi:hypothetical protein
MPSRLSVAAIVVSCAVTSALVSILAVGACSPSNSSTAGDAGADGADAGVGLTCGMLLLCDQPCNSDSCTNGCYAQSTGVAQGLFNALTDCINEHCSNADGGPCASASSSACSSCQTGAATGSCVSKLESCEQDTTVGPPDPDGGGVVVPPNDAGMVLNCGQYTSCLAGCGASGGTCGSSCTSQATPEAMALAGALNGCLTMACPSTNGGPCAMSGMACNGCVEQSEFGGACSASYTACQNDTSNSPDASTTPTVLEEGGTLSTVLTGVDQIGSTMLIQDGYLYFAQENVSNQVHRLWVGDGGAVDAGTLTAVGPAQPTPVAIAVNADSVYVWNYGSFTGKSSLNNSDGTVVQIPLDGGAEQTVGKNVQVFFAAPYLNAIAVDSQNVYWVQGASGNNGVIMKATLGSTGGTAIYTQQYFPEALVTDGTNIYWASWGTYDAQGNSNNDGTIQKGSINGGTPVTLAKNLSAPACMAIDSNNVYWTNLGKMGGNNLPALNTGSVLQVPIAGGPVVTLASQESVPVGIALRGNDVYWTEYGLGSLGLVLSAPKGGGTVAPLVANLRNPYSLVLQGNTMYWSYYMASTPSSSTPLIDSLSPF